MTTDSKPCRYVTWNLRSLMDKHGIRRVADLHRRLGEHGVTISSTQLARTVAQRPKRLPTDLLDGLVTVLNCKIDELLTIENPESEETATPTASIATSSLNIPKAFTVSKKA